MNDGVFWQRKVQRTQGVINFGWWLQFFVPAAIVVTLLSVIFLLSARRAGVSQTALLATSAGLFAAAVAFAFVRARTRFLSKSRVRALLDYSLALETRLTAAAAGVGNSPATTQWHGMPWRWNVRRSVLPLIGCVAMLIAAWSIPIRVARPPEPPPLMRPPALAEVEQWLETLQQTPVIDPQSLETVQEQADELARQNSDEWYSHSNLEAADHLRMQLQTGIAQLDAAAGKLESLLGALDENAATAMLTAAEWSTQLNSALGMLDSGAPRLSPELAKQLRNIDPSKLRTLTPAQLRALQERLREARGICQECLGDCDGDLLAVGSQPTIGNGAITRGPGSVPLTLAPDPVDLGRPNMEPVENPDLSRAALGDVFGTSTGQHEVDRKVNHRVAAGGAAAAPGAGADAVWIPQNLTPDEQSRLRAFFK